MTKLEYQQTLHNLLQSMIGERVNHINYGVGTIINVDGEKCVVKYDRFDVNKQMSSERFFLFHEPVSEATINKYRTLKCKYEMANYSQLSKSEDDSKNASCNKITFDDVIGLDNVKELIFQMVVYPFKYQDIYKAFKRNSGGGILLYGAPGTGKTMIAKAIANEIDAKFYSIKCSDITSKWFGESERRIRELFENARKNERSIIFFDEFDALGTNRNNNNSHSVNMMVSEFLSQIDGFESIENTILLIASTNKPWNIDSALLQSGRFNKKIYVGLPDKVSRYKLLMHELSEVPISDIDYEDMALQTDCYSSADIVELCNQTKDIAIKRSIELNQISPIGQEDLIKAKSIVSSTVVRKELERLKNFKIVN